MMTRTSARVDQVERTRARILLTAERLFAEHGVLSVSNRQISEAAGQGNNAAVGYHFGTKADLVTALVRRHNAAMERLRERLLARHEGSDALRDRVECVVRPFTDHLASLGTPSWYARFAAQVITDPPLRELAAAELRDAPMFNRVLDELHRCLPALPPAVRDERDHMVHTLIVHLCAQHERGGAGQWDATATGLVDAIVGLLEAPASSPTFKAPA